MAAHYRKGANAERELLHRFFEAGFSVARVAGSGSARTPCPDLLAFKGRKRYAFECKAKRGPYLHVPVAQFEATRAWARNAGAAFFVAWKIPRKGWRFLSEKDFHRNPGHYAVSLRSALERGLSLERLL